MKYYAIARGRQTGIFTNWPEAEQQVKGFANARYKSFKTRKEAEAFLDDPFTGSTRTKPKVKTTSSGKAKSRSKKNRDETLPGTIEVYTDGGAIGNPGPGGYGVVIKDEKEFSGGYNLTTNNRMELMAVIAALKELQGTKAPIVLYSDSRYVINGITKGWAKGWKKRNWKKANGLPALNPDLWDRLLVLLTGVNITFKWVKGHSGNPLNERCDRLANGTARKNNLPDDKGYLKRNPGI